MILGIDIHGTIDSNPEFFRNNLKEIIENGDSVYIISGAPAGQMSIDLSELGFNLGEHYNKLISIVDFLKSCRTKLWKDKKGNWWCDDEIWWKSKARICHVYNVNVLIDDRVEYSENLNQVEFGLWNSKDQLVTFQ